VICPSCSGTQLGSSFTNEGIVFRCLNGDCKCEFRDGATVEDDDEPFVGIRPQMEAPRAAAKPAPKPATPTKRITDRGIVAQAKAELRELNREIARLRKLELQRDAIKRLLDAADRKPNAPATVRALRTNTGN
jgi:hypothetical protein